MKHLRLYEEYLSLDTFSDEEVINYIRDITPEESDIPDWSFENEIKGRTFKQRPIDLKGLLISDPSFKEYYDSGEERYDQKEMNPDDINKELVIVDGSLVDGYSRASFLLRKGNDKTGAFVAVK